MEKISEELFNARITRLKVLLGVHEDRDVAIHLEMRGTALSARKRRGTFPIKNLRLLCAKRGLDIDYILNGGAVQKHHVPALGEEALLQRFRAMSHSDQSRLIAIADVFVGEQA